MSFIRLKATGLIQWPLMRFSCETLTDVFDFFEIVVVRPEIDEVLSSFVELFGHPSPHDNLLFDRKVLKGLRYERQLPQGRLAYWTWCGAKREQSVDT